MSVDLEPGELAFRRPFTSEVSQVLRLHNPNNDPVAFKVKTTAPKQYCVRPNSGRIEAGRDVEVQVLLQAMKEDPPPDARCRDKFLVQSVAVTADKEIGNVQQIWSNIEQTSKSSIQEKKIRVNFLPADGDTSSGGGLAAAAGGVGAAGGLAGGAAAANGMSQHDDDGPPAYSSPSPAAVTPARSVAQGPISTPSDKPYNSTNRGEAVNSAHNPATDSNSTFGSAAAAVSSAIPTSSSELQQQLDAANAKIKQLTEQASEGLRQRKTANDPSEGSSSKLSMQNAPAPGGVPVQIVAGLCLLSFLIAYLLF